ncbi:uncharacterized protein EV154DRAFT_450794 [Mucor mucedo]|uniref:uncharacterized protein n=1 Tax=Mucor mucedo TaxID=29922 RepID=UPI00221F556D|nr:uncharacterized protein EV154DRAFT_450794 [Mucor mucedo]KAI7880279.1 hypothetical protein EV154DRAFT_450794 [Mucor mucedo]
MEKDSMCATILISHKQLQLYHTVSSDSMDNTLSSLQRPDQSAISTNTPSSPASFAETEPTSENVWSIWSDTLHTMLTEDNNDEDVHEYSLEYLGIIILGHHVGNKQSRKFYPKELQLKTNELIQTPIDDVIQKFHFIHHRLNLWPCRLTSVILRRWSYF